MRTKTIFLWLSATLLITPVLFGAPRTSHRVSSLQPEGYLKQWVILGPFPNPERKEGAKDRGAFDVDYLKSLGGEAKTRFRPGAIVTWTDPKGEVIRATGKQVSLPGTTLDFPAHYTDTDYKLAYAYTQIKSSRPQQAFFFLGSDDGAKVWVNGKRVFDRLIPRAAVARQDHFTAQLRTGANSILVKVENGIGAWALVMEIYDQEEGRKLQAQIAAEAKAKAFMGESLACATNPGHVFWPAWTGIPRIIWRDADRVHELVGTIPFTVHWFDANLKAVTSPDKPGRCAAVITGKMRDGTPVRRAMTFFCVANDTYNPWAIKGIQVPYPGKPFDTDVWKESGKYVSADADSIYREGLLTREEGAIFLSWITEAKPLGRPLTFTDSSLVANDDYQLALKLKLEGLAKKTRPLAPPKQRATPATVLHEGTPAEAGVKPDAKEKIDAVCRQWAEDSGEPFSILVARHGVIVTHAAFGKQADGAPVTTDYRWDVASITKAVTGMLFSQFLDQGYVKLDDPIGKYLPGFPTSGDRMLTYRHLFTHTSGLEGHGEWGGIHNPYLENVILDGLKSLHPGQIHRYNGMGYDLAAKAMETMTGKSIVRLFHDHLFRPLGINDVPVDDCAYGGHFTAYELGVLAQFLANHGSYGDQQFISKETFQQLLPVPLEKYYSSLPQILWGVGLVWMGEQKPNTPPFSREPKDFILSPHTIGHGSATSCILRVDLDHDLVITQIRKTAGTKYGEYATTFFTAIADSIL